MEWCGLNVGAKITAQVKASCYSTYVKGSGWSVVKMNVRPVDIV